MNACDDDDYACVFSTTTADAATVITTLFTVIGISPHFFVFLTVFVFLPRTHAQGVKQSVLSVICRCRWHENHQISRSRHLSDS